MDLLEELFCCKISKIWIKRLQNSSDKKYSYEKISTIFSSNFDHSLFTIKSVKFKLVPNSSRWWLDLNRIDCLDLPSTKKNHIFCWVFHFFHLISSALLRLMNPQYLSNLKSNNNYNEIKSVDFCLCISNLLQFEWLNLANNWWFIQFTSICEEWINFEVTIEWFFLKIMKPVGNL